MKYQARKLFREYKDEKDPNTILDQVRFCEYQIETIQVKIKAIDQMENDPVSDPKVEEYNESLKQW